MDIDALHSALLSIALVSEKLRSTRKSLSASKRETIAMSEFFNDVEGDLGFAKATLAGELGFDLCPQCWPPELLVTDLSGRVNCPVCGQVSRDQAA